MRNIAGSAFKRFTKMLKRRRSSIWKRATRLGDTSGVSATVGDGEIWDEDLAADFYDRRRAIYIPSESRPRGMQFFQTTPPGSFVEFDDAMSFSSAFTPESALFETSAIGLIQDQSYMWPIFPQVPGIGGECGCCEESLILREVSVATPDATVDRLAESTQENDLPTTRQQDDLNASTEMPFPRTSPSITPLDIILDAYDEGESSPEVALMEEQALSLDRRCQDPRFEDIPIPCIRKCYSPGTFYMNTPASAFDGAYPSLVKSSAYNRSFSSASARTFEYSTPESFGVPIASRPSSALTFGTPVTDMSNLGEALVDAILAGHRGFHVDTDIGVS
ncbi:hypothetical protein FRB99_008849 [Tulasnella sp. 403]|nr:hypothetical protein FRB99_008849 [Tulasnella sp. 403]